MVVHSSLDQQQGRSLRSDRPSAGGRGRSWANANWHKLYHHPPPPSSIWFSPGSSALRQSADEWEEIPLFPYHDTALASHSQHHSRPDGHREAWQAVDCKHLAFKSRCGRSQGKLWGGVGPMRTKADKGGGGQFWFIFCGHPLWMTPSSSLSSLPSIHLLRHLPCPRLHHKSSLSSPSPSVHLWRRHFCHLGCPFISTIFFTVVFAARQFRRHLLCPFTPSLQVWSANYPHSSVQVQILHMHKQTVGRGCSMPLPCYVDEMVNCPIGPTPSLAAEEFDDHQSQHS